MDLLTYPSLLTGLNRKLQQHISRICRPCILQHHMTEMQYEVLSYIAAHNACKIKDLVEELAQDAGNMSTLCKKLEKASLLTRVRDDKDERIVRLYISEQGASRIEQINQAIAERYERLFEGKTNKEKERFTTGCIRMNQFLDYIMGKGGEEDE